MTDANVLIELALAPSISPVFSRLSLSALSLQFPFKSFDATLTDGTQINLSGAELNDALQYSDTPGIPSFLSELKVLQIREHSPPYQQGTPSAASAAPELAVAVTTGSQDALTKAFEMLLNPGDPVLVENPTYSGALAYLKPMKLQLVGVDVDDHGIVPASLEKRLTEWEHKARK